MKKKWLLRMMSSFILFLVLFTIIEYQNTPSLKNILNEKGIIIINQEEYPCTLSIPHSIITENAYLSSGQKFKTNEVIVHQTETSSIYLEKIMLSNESDSFLYFIFNFKNTYPDAGEVILPYLKTEYGYTNFSKLASKTLATETQEYKDAVSLRAQGPGTEFTFYVSADACRSAEGVLKIEAIFNNLTYTLNP